MAKQRLIEQLGKKTFKSIDYALALGGKLSIVISAVLVVFCIIVMLRGKMQN